MAEYLSVFAFFLVILRQSFAMTSDTALLVMGGGSHIYIDSHDESPVLKSFEIFGCSTSSLPDYPREVFGANMIWMERDGEKVLLVCGGADWKTVHNSCHIWNPR